MIKKIFLTLFAFVVILNAQSVENEFDNAVKLFGDKEYSAALDIFKSIYSKSENSDVQKSSAKFYAAECLLNLNELDGAAIEYESFVELYPFSNFWDQAVYQLGTIYLIKGEYRKCRDKLVYLNNFHPSNEYRGSANYWIAESFAAENKIFEAEEYFKEAVSERTNNKYVVNSIYSLAQLYEKLGNYTNAVTYYDELLAYYKTSPLAPQAQIRIGICYFKLKEYYNAVLELTDPLIKTLSEKEQFEANYFLANSFTRLREYKNAADIYEDILKTDISENLTNKINYSLAWVNFQLSNYDAAYNLFDQIQKSGDDTLAASALFWSAECKRYSGDTKAANTIYNLFLERYPANALAARAELGKGTIFYGSSNSRDAEKALLNASISNDALIKGKANTLLGEMRLNEKKFDEAKNYFQTALKYTEDSDQLNNRAKLGMGVAEFYLDDVNTAANYFENLYKDSPAFEKDKVNFYLAECYSARGDYAAALKHYNSINTDDNLLRKLLLYGKAYAYFNSKDFPNAVYYFNEYVNKYGNERNATDAKLRLADSYYGLKNFSKASAIYSDLFRYDKSIINNDYAYYQYCQALYKAGRSSEAIDEFESLQKRFPHSRYADVSQYVIGWIHFQQSNYDGAIDSYEKLIQKYPRSNLIPIAYYSLGDSYFNKGNYDTSIVFYNKVLTQYPNTPYILDAVNGIQYAYIAEDHAEQAVSFIDDFITVNPNSKYSDQIYFKKGDILYSAEKYEDAITAYRDFISKYPNSDFIPNAYYWIGKSAANLKNVSEAENNFITVIQYWQKSDIGLSASIELANLYSELTNYAAAEKVLDDATSAMPTSNRLPELLFLKGTAEVKEEKLQEAYETFDQIIKYYDSSVFSAKAKLELGLLELNRKSYENADMFFKELGEKRTDDIGAQAQYNYGVSLLEQEKVTDAITAFVRVRSVFSGFDEWYTKSLMKLGDCYVQLKDKKQARDMYRAVIERHNTGDLAKEAKRKLNRL